MVDNVLYWIQDVASDSRSLKGGSMLRKRHSPEEIAAKLLQSDEMAKAGKLQAEISRALGISLMTYHRWRKLRNQSAPISAVSNHGKETNVEEEDSGDLVSRISQLHFENSRLRRLVTDLLLETDKLEEALALPSSRHLSALPGALIRRNNTVSRRTTKRRNEPATAKPR